MEVRGRHESIYEERGFCENVATEGCHNAESDKCSMKEEEQKCGERRRSHRVKKRSDEDVFANEHTIIEREMKLK